MEKYTKIADQLLIALGGQENIQTLTHCVTRLRVIVKDESLIQQVEINELELVKGSQFQSGQFQVIIGPVVKNVYAAMMLREAKQIQTVEQAPQQTKRWYQQIITTLAEILIPILPVVIAGGLIVGLESILTEIPFMNGNTLVESLPILAPISHILFILGQTIFLFLPVLVAFVTTKRFGGSPILGIVVGIAMVLPSFYPIENGDWNLGFLSNVANPYVGQVLPAIAAGFIVAQTEKFLTKHVPDLLKVLIIPAFSFIFTFVIISLVIGPIAQELGFLIGAGARVMLTGSFRLVFGFLFGLVYAPLTLTGFHHLFLLVDLQLISEGGTMLWPMIALSNIAQGSAAFATYFLYRQNKKQQHAAIEATQAALIGGVTEPAMFGVNLPLKSAFYAALIGSGIASGSALLLEVQANAIGIGGIPAILSIPPVMWGSYFSVIAIALIVPFSLTLVFAKFQKQK